MHVISPVIQRSPRLHFLFHFSVISLQAFGIDAELAIAQLVISIEHHASVSSLVTLISGHLG